MRIVLTVVTAVLLQSACLFAAESVNTTGRWYGVVEDPSLQEAAPANGVVADPESWKSLWETWRPDQELPQVDFDKEIVVVGVVPGPNRVLLRPVLAEAGDLRFVVAGTKMAGPGFGYALVKVSRDGVKTVNGKPIRRLIEVQGKLSTGIMAIGGETTGTILNDGGTHLGTGLQRKRETEQLGRQTEWEDGGGHGRARTTRRGGGQAATHNQGAKPRRPLAKGDEDKAALTGKVVIPANLASFDSRTLEVKLWQYDPLLADVSADLVDELMVRDYSHKFGTETNTRFALGKPDAVREDRAYYLTVFVTDNGKRTHMGEKDGERGLCKVLTQGNPDSVEMIVREVGR